MSIMAARVRRDGLGIGKGRPAMPNGNLLYRCSSCRLRQWSRKTHFLRFPTHARAAHGPVKGPNQCGIVTCSPRGARDASWTTAPSSICRCDGPLQKELISPGNGPSRPEGMVPLRLGDCVFVGRRHTLERLPKTHRIGPGHRTFNPGILRPPGWRYRLEGSRIRATAISPAGG